MLGCPWDGSVCANAAAGGHLHVLQWLREKGCPWHKDTPAWAELNGHIAIKALGPASNRGIAQLHLRASQLASLSSLSL